MYICIAKIITGYRDTNNNWCRSTRDLSLVAKTLEALYEALAAARIKHTWTEGDEDYPDEKSEITFGPIHLIAESSPLDEAALQATSVWRAHQAALDAERLETEQLAEEQAQADAEAAQLAAVRAEAAELAAYHRVKAKLEAAAGTRAQQ